MNGKRIVATVIFLLIMFMSVAGQSSEQMFQSGATFDDAYSASMLNAAISVGFACIQMIIIPLVCRLVKGQKLPQKGGKILCLWNSIGMFLLSSVLFTMHVPLPITIGGLGALFFYFINRWLFVED